MQKRYLRKRLSSNVTAFERVTLVQLMEEAAEVIHAASKVLRWGFEEHHPDADDGNNAERLANEMVDVNDAYARVLEARNKKKSTTIAVRLRVNHTFHRRIMDQDTIDKIVAEMRTLVDAAFAELATSTQANITAQIEDAKATLRGEFHSLNGTLRDSLLAANSQLVIDTNATFRGIHARLDAAELGRNPQVMLTIGNMASALRDTAAKLGED